LRQPKTEYPKDETEKEKEGAKSDRKKSPKEKSHERTPSWGTTSVGSVFTSSGSIKLPTAHTAPDGFDLLHPPPSDHQSNSDSPNSSSSSSPESEEKKLRMRIGKSFESPKDTRGKLDRRDRDSPPLHKAVIAKDSMMVRQLVEEGIKHRKIKPLLFDRDGRGRTALHVAAETKGCIGVLALLLSLAADDLKAKYMQRLLNACDLLGRTPIHCAAK